MHVCRARVHNWGRLNRVAFDPVKEHSIIIHSSQGEGDPFKLLGLLVDCKLIMQQAVDKLLTQIRPKVHAILRTKKFYNTKELIGQFKTHVWGLMECHNCGIFHASSYILEKLDEVHHKFVEKLEISAEEAFISYNFASPNLRRDIGILGMLHKRVLGKSHPVFQRLLPFSSEGDGAWLQNGHSRQLNGHLEEANFQLALFCRSIFAMTYVYNKLPQAWIDCTSVSLFQRCLTLHARSLCKAGDPNWALTHSCRK